MCLKALCFSVILLSLICWLRERGNYTVNNLFEDTEHTAEKQLLTWYQGDCFLHSYSQRETHVCFWNKSSVFTRPVSISFVGDSCNRQLFLALRDHMTGEVTPFKKIHHSMMYKNNSLKIVMDFQWRPLPEYVIKYLLTQTTIRKTQGPGTALVIISLGLHHMKRFSRRKDKSSIISEFKKYTVIVGKLCDGMRPDLLCIWRLIGHINETVHNRRQQCLDHSPGFLSNKLIDRYNQAASEVLKNTSVIVWKNSVAISKRFLSDTQNNDGVHLGKTAMNLNLQILLNLLCNPPTEGDIYDTEKLHCHPMASKY